jgi:hypothetical protein
MQFFKETDDVEKKYYNSALPITDQIDIQKDLFYNEAYEAAPLGDVIYEDSRSPLSNAIDQAIFRESVKEIFDAFVQVGTFESYITVFKKIFGDDVMVDFTVPAPGKLNIDIEAAGVELADFISRYIEDNTYLFDEVIDDEGDNIVFQSVKGFQSQYELEQMLFEMVPAGIFTTISLTIGA